MRLKSQRRRWESAQPAIDTKTCSFQLDRSLCTAGQTCLHDLSLSFAGPREYRWQGLEVPAMMGKRRGTAQITTASPAGCAASNPHKNLLFSQLARSLYVQQAKHDPEAIFELRWSARIPLARPGGAGHDGKPSWCGSNRNGVDESLRGKLSTQKPALFNSIAHGVHQAKLASIIHL